MAETDNGKAALAFVEQQPLALLCLDLMLGESSGYDICARVRKLPGLQDLPVMIVSARALPFDRALAEEVGSNAYLTKPIRWKQFAATVKMLTGG